MAPLRAALPVKVLLAAALPVTALPVTALPVARTWRAELARRRP
jgi:hypothetical protein